MIETAKQYLNAGLSVIAVYVKQPAKNVGSQTPYFKQRPSQKELEHFFKGDHTGIGVIMGESSNNLVCIDVDQKNDPSNEIADKLWHGILDIYKNQPPPFFREKTPNGGEHIFYRTKEFVPDVTKNIARSQESGNVIVEMMTNKCYAVIYPTPGYKKIMGDMTQLPVLSVDEHNELIELCASFNEVTETYKPKTRSYSTKLYKENPWDVYNKKDHWRDVLKSKGWVIAKETQVREYWKRPGTSNPQSGNYHYEHNTFTCFSESAGIHPDVVGKAMTPYDVLLHFECGGDAVKAQEVALEKGCGKAWSSHEQQAMDKAVELAKAGMPPERIRQEISEMNLPISKDSIYEILNRSEQYAKGIFWYYKDKKIKIDQVKLARFIEKEGYYQLENGGGNAKYGHLDPKKHIFRECDRSDIKRHVADTLNKMDLTGYDTSRDQIIQLVYAMTDSRWNNTLEYMRKCNSTTIPPLRDTKDCSYIPYINAIAKVTKDNITLIDYEELEEGQYVWEEQIKDHYLYLEDTQGEWSVDRNIDNTWLLIKRLAGIDGSIEHLTLRELEENHTKKYQKLKSICSILGYYVHTYKDSTEQRAVWVSEEVATSEEGGGSGKGIISQMIRQIRKMAAYEGRRWNNDANFLWSKVTPGTSVIFIDDAQDKFDFGLLYSAVTDFIEVEQKYKQAYNVDYSTSPKILITSNFTNITDGVAGDRRIVRTYVSTFFGIDHTPKDEFGTEFFRETWSYTEWNRFHNTMLYITQWFLNEGLYEEPESEIIRARNFIAKYSKQLYGFLKEFVESERSRDWQIKTGLRDEFLESTGWRSYSNDKWNKALNAFAELNGLFLHDKYRKISDPFSGKKKTVKAIFFGKTEKDLPKQDENEVIEDDNVPF